MKEENPKKILGTQIPKRVMGVLELLNELREVHEIHVSEYKAKHQGEMWDINAQLNHIHSEVSEGYELLRGKEHGKPIKYPKDCNSQEERIAYLKYKMTLELWDVCFSAIAGMEMISDSDLALIVGMEETLIKIQERVGIKK